MTIVKLISCTVDDDNVAAFTASQCAWQQLENCSGFLAQVGGWRADLSQLPLQNHAAPLHDKNINTAVFFGFWQSTEDVTAFMETTHDQIFTANHQGKTYQTCQVKYFEMLPTSSNLVVANPNAEIISLSHYVADLAKMAQLQQLYFDNYSAKGLVDCQLLRPRRSLKPQASAQEDANVEAKVEFMLVCWWRSQKQVVLMQNKTQPKQEQQGQLTALSEQVIKLEPKWNVQARGIDS
ncbi:DUF4937 domain-containing protein [Shewanella sp. UCD-KL21]|uniref:DUF4937 domain-containing protein n=1 Tax=Shewanella sp. UCD-KL21 TaxID=1917164 RepID=UPI0009703D2D|nr:DUF4937 domain-containing protein [Shewanella sp. UCD-KL21]